MRERRCVEGDALVAKEIPLRQPQAQGLGAGLRVEHAGGDTGGELVRVRDPVDAAEGVVGEHRFEVEVFRCGVEIRQPGLVAKRRVHVQHARLQRLPNALAEPARVALEDPGAVDAETRNHTRQAALALEAAAGQRRIERVGGGVEGQAGRDRPARRHERQRQAAQRMHPQAGRAAEVHRGQVVGIGEAVELALEADFEARPDAPRDARAHLRHALVGRIDRRVQALQQLPLLHPCVRGPVAERAAEQQVRQQQARREAGQGARKVFPVVVVGHVQRAQLQARLPRQVAVVAQVQRVTGAAGGAVVGQQVQAGRAAVARLEVAELARQPRAAPAADDGRQRGIALRRDVPVIRHRHLQAALAVGVDVGWQPARLARVGERKTEHRRSQDRHPHETQHGTFGDAFVGLEIELDAVGAEQPRRPAGAVGRAARIGGPCGKRALLAQEIEPLGHTARTDLPEVVGRVLEEAFETLHLELQFGPAVDVAVAADAHVAQGSSQVVGLVVAQAVGPDHRAATAKFGVAFGHRFKIGAAAQLARQQDDRQLLCGLAARRRLQCGRGPQDDALGRLGIVLCCRSAGPQQAKRGSHRQQPQP